MAIGIRSAYVPLEYVVYFIFTAIPQSDINFETASVYWSSVVE